MRSQVPSFESLPERSRRVLALLVREYIERGEPVSSLWLAEHASLGVSSATLRSIMARLEEEGYVHQPHTSAGRVPTDLGYRVYVDLLLQGRRPGRSGRDVEARLRQAGTVDHVMASASHEVSRVSHHLGFALAPPDEGITLKHIEFVSLDASRALVVLVTGAGQVWHKVVTPAEALSPAELTQAANYLNREFSGWTLGEIRSSVVASMNEDRVLYDRLVSRALTLASSSLGDLPIEPRLYVHGASLLLDVAAAGEGQLPLETLRAVLRLIEEKHRLIQLLTEYVEGPGLTIVIGAEHTAPDLRDFSLVASTAAEGGQTATVGVIGPRRMRYRRAIAAVEVASQAVGRVLVNPDRSN
jgi:heat-inducible transcriptional repressor